MKRIAAKKIMILGARGLLGSACREYLAGLKRYKVSAFDRDRADITDRSKLFRLFRREKPDAVINCAAIINVEYCEAHPLEVWLTNAVGAGNVAAALAESGARAPLMLQISTSDVFGSGRNSHREEDPPSPVNIYGLSKLGGEYLSAFESARGKARLYILRTSWLYGKAGSKTFVDTVAGALQSKKRISAITDQWSVLTSAFEAARAMEKIIRNPLSFPPGIYHMVNTSPKALSRYEIALAIAKILKATPSLIQKTSRHKFFSVPRPRSAFLKNSKMPPLKDWRVALNSYLKSNYLHGK